MRVTATCITAPSPTTSAPTGALAATRSVLDYGCGEATSADLRGRGLRPSHAGRGGAQCARGAEGALRRQRRKFPCCTPDEAAALPAGVVRSHRAAFGGAVSRARPNSTACSAIFRELIKPDGLLIIGDIVPPHLARAGRGAGAAALRRRQRIFLGRGRRADADFRVGLSAAEEDGRAVALRRGGDAGEAQGRRLCGARARRAISATISGA